MTLEQLTKLSLISTFIGLTFGEVVIMIKAFELLIKYASVLLQ